VYISFGILTAFALIVGGPAPQGVQDPLKGIDWMAVRTDDEEEPGDDAKQAGLTLELLRTDLTSKLRAAGMKMEEVAGSPHLGLLSVQLKYKAIRPAGGGPAAFAAYVGLQLKQDVQLLRDMRPAPMLATTWEHGTLIAGSGQGKEEVRKALAALADKLAAEYRAANSKASSPQHPAKP
jgi:hypothetical protein